MPGVYTRSIIFEYMMSNVNFMTFKISHIFQLLEGTLNNYTRRFRPPWAPRELIISGFKVLSVPQKDVLRRSDLWRFRCSIFCYKGLKHICARGPCFSDFDPLKESASHHI